MRITVHWSFFDGTDVSVLESAHDTSPHELGEVMCQALQCRFASRRYLYIDQVRIIIWARFGRPEIARVGLGRVEVSGDRDALSVELLWCHDELLNRHIDRLRISDSRGRCHEPCCCNEETT